MNFDLYCVRDFREELDFLNNAGPYKVFLVDIIFERKEVEKKEDGSRDGERDLHVTVTYPRYPTLPYRTKFSVPADPCKCGPSSKKFVPRFQHNSTIDLNSYFTHHFTRSNSLPPRRQNPYQTEANISRKASMYCAGYSAANKLTDVKNKPSST
jgi:hypothetical protein